MTRRLVHTKPEIRNAVAIAIEHGLTVRLEADGAITFIPTDHSEKISAEAIAGRLPEPKA